MKEEDWIEFGALVVARRWSLMPMEVSVKRLRYVFVEVLSLLVFNV
jgi:hypothetical protein